MVTDYAAQRDARMSSISALAIVARQMGARRRGPLQVIRRVRIGARGA